MAYQGIGTGTAPNDNTGDSLLTGANKINNNFQEIYNTLGDGSNLLGGYIPIGGIIMWSGSIVSIPTGWNLCNGSNGTPNLQDKFIVGAGNNYAVNDTGGADSVTLDTTQIPAHSHSGSTSGAGAHSHSGSTSGAGAHSHSGSTSGAGAHSHSTTFAYAYDLGSSGRAGGGANSVQNYLTSQSINGVGDHAHSLSTSGVGDHAHSVTTSGVEDHAHSVTVGNTGGGQAHENRPPYYALAFIMRTS